ncbi:extracellular solute-binding protein [Paenibacillus sp. PAMC21692]|uniref:extracellular solute-binding protein n=1 Tax=Paenibacillus sp. PAMC21692 TaxID=2762320 RepID=UPI00164DA44F|nr:extracellular solute-binding protein [Paenibacillus sp. PAMC21692]QNK58965.1 extracellular solute-binding protein [Paenibacillus sp. PAMC21692]
MIRKKAVLLMVSMIMIFVVAGCSGNNSGKTEPTATSSARTEGEKEQATPDAGQNKEPVKLSFYYSNVPLKTEGRQTDEVMLELEKRLGVEIDFINQNTDRFKLMMASRELPDIMVVFDQDYKQLIEGGLILPLDDLIQSKGKDIAKNAEALDYYRQYLSSDTGKLYLLPMQVGATKEMVADVPYADYGAGYLTRWDYYKELGFPEIKSPDDLLAVLKAMQEKHPTTADGKKVYGVSSFVDKAGWGLWPFYIQMSLSQGYMEGAGNYLIDADNNFYNFLANEEGAFWDSMKYFFKANQMGLLDPESFIQNLDQYQNKQTNLQVLSGIGAWWQAGANEALADIPDAGFVTLPMENHYVYKTNVSIIGKAGRAFAIAKNSKNPEKAMEVLNYLYSNEGMNLLSRGIQGKHWDIVDNQAAYTDSFLKARVNVDEAEKIGVTKYALIYGLSDYTVNSDEGIAFDLNSESSIESTDWKGYQLDYAKHYGGEYPGDAIEKMADQGKIKISLFDTSGGVAVGTPPDDIKRIDDSIKDYMWKAMPKVILAKSEADYETEKKNVINELNKLGLDKSKEYWDKVWQQSINRVKK